MGARSSQSRGPGLNETDGHLLEYFRNTFTGGGGADSGPTAAPPGFGGPQGLTATGGVVSDYVDGDEVYRAHVFTSSGTFAVTDSTSDFPLSSKYEEFPNLVAINPVLFFILNLYIHFNTSRQI